MICLDVPGFTAVRARMGVPPVEPHLPALAYLRVCIRLRAMISVSAGSAPCRGLFSARVPRFESIFGFHARALSTKSVAGRNYFLSRQPFALFYRFSSDFAAPRTVFECCGVHALACIATAFFGCYNLSAFHHAMIR